MKYLSFNNGKSNEHHNGDGEEVKQCESNSSSDKRCHLLVEEDDLHVVQGIYYITFSRLHVFSFQNALMIIYVLLLSVTKK